MSEPKYPRTYYAHQSGITGPCYLYSHANNCDIPAPEGNYVRESDYDQLRKERDRLKEQRWFLLSGRNEAAALRAQLQQEQRTMLIECGKLTAERDEALQREAKNADKLKHYRMHFIPKLEAELAELRTEHDRLRDELSWYAEKMGLAYLYAMNAYAMASEGSAEAADYQAGLARSTFHDLVNQQEGGKS